MLQVSDDDLKEMLSQADDDGTGKAFASSGCSLHGEKSSAMTAVTFAGQIEFEEFCRLMGLEVPSKAGEADAKVVPSDTLCSEHRRCH